MNWASIRLAAHDATTPGRTGVNYPKMLAAAIVAFQAALVGESVESCLIYVVVHDYFLLRLSCV